MANSLRITVDELKNRMEGGEDFTMVDVRKPDVWTESDTMIPESIRVPLGVAERWGKKPSGRILATLPLPDYRRIARDLGKIAMGGPGSIGAHSS